MRAALFAWGLSASIAWANNNPSLYPAAQCAAFWLGFTDYARISAYLDVDPTDKTRAEAFRAVALRLGTATPDTINGYIAEQRPLMAATMEAMIYGQNRAARDMFERLTERCSAFGAEHPETRMSN